MGKLTGSSVLSLVVPLLFLPKIRYWSLVFASSSYGGASLFDCRVKAMAFVDFIILSSGVTVGVFIAWCLNLKVSVNLKDPVSVSVLTTE